jgi:hypothetical protein
MTQHNTPYCTEHTDSYITVNGWQYAHFTKDLHFISLHSTPLYCTSLNFTSSFFTSLHFWTFRHHHSKTLHSSSLVITFRTLFLKICDLQGKVAINSTGVLSCTKYMNLCCEDCGSVCVRNVLCRKVKLHYNGVMGTQSAVRRSKETGVDTEAADGLCHTGRR